MWRGKDDQNGQNVQDGQDRGGRAVLVDTHAHLDHELFAADQHEVIQRAREAGVCYIVTIGSDVASSEAAVRLAEQYEGVWAAVGIHPHDASGGSEEAFYRIEELARHPRVVAIGEIGLDYHYDHSPRPVQREVFIRQLELARKLDLPFVVHNREADADTMAILREHGAGMPGLLHSFAGSPDMAEECLRMGYFISTGGMVTFKKADAVREAIGRVPLDRLLLETDAPYLTPVPLRGRRNEPAFVRHVAEFVAEWRGVSFDELARITTANACRFFRLPQVAG
ncbi:MAG: TatD family hydrolase [Firmicutes bacterium]|nr:TatD family hydrolase [Bacillota bacterium]